MDKIRKFKSECRIYKTMKRRAFKTFDAYEGTGPFEFSRNMEKIFIAKTTNHVEDVFGFIQVHFSENDKEMMWTHYIEGLSIQETADQYHISYDTLKLRMKRILENALAETEVS